MSKKPIARADAMSDAEKKVFYEEIGEWNKAVEQLAKLRDREMELRKALIEKYFVGAEEGTNTVKLEFGKALKAQVVISRTVDADALAELKAKAKPGSNVMKIADDLFVYKPSLSISEWKGLSDDDRKLFAAIVTEKPGSPQLKLETVKG